MVNVDKVVVDGIDEIIIPKMARLKQKIGDPRIESISDTVRQEIESTGFSERIKKGSRVAVGVGSRGIHRLDEVVENVISIIKELGGEPFIVPAMGSHGGATAEGQREVLEGYGITEERMGAPIVTSMEVVKLGETDDGKPVYFSKVAFEADAVVVVNRVKVHTDFSGVNESGIMKMLVIGFGKHKGAATIHSYGFDVFHELIPEAGRVMLEKAPIALGIGLLENGYDHLYKIKAMDPADVEEIEQEMLREQKDTMPAIPFKNVDVLIVDEMGKNISGSGMDTNIVGRIKESYADIKYIVIRDLTPETHGNACGLGLADFTTKRFFDKLELNSTYTNLLTARNIGLAKIPMILKSDEYAIKTALKMTSKSPEEVKMVRIKNTLELVEMDISEGLLQEAEELDGAEIGKMFRYSFKEDGYLD